MRSLRLDWYTSIGFSTPLKKESREALSHYNFTESDSLVSTMDSLGWSELDPRPGTQDLYRAYDILTFLRDSPLEDLPAHLVVPDNPTLFQFYSDVFAFGSFDDYSDVLVSFLDDDGGRQSYYSYTSEGVADVEYFLDEISASPALIFCGRFRDPKAGWNVTPSYRVATKSRLTALNCVCIDVDTERTKLEKIDASTLQAFFNRLPNQLLPSYVSFSGHGLHLWYVFRNPLQTCREYEPKRKKINSLFFSLYTAVAASIEGLPLHVDNGCMAPTHAFRAPGSLTKDKGIVRCFCKTENLFRSPFKNPVELSAFCVSRFGLEEIHLLTEEDCSWETEEALRAKAKRRHEDFLSAPATAAQLNYIDFLISEKAVALPDGLTLETITKPEAMKIISDAQEDHFPSSSSNKSLPVYPTWKTRPHFLNGDGVYRTILNSIGQVGQGRRELSLYMLAGVAYMTTRPEIPLTRLRRDFESLLNTPWARTSSPLTQHDIESALTGYRRENWRTRSSIVETLGFDPFASPAKRNGRTREEHMITLMRPGYQAFAEERASSIVARVSELRAAHPSASQRTIAEASGYSRKTVRKYWDTTSPVGDMSTNQ